MARTAKRKSAPIVIEQKQPAPYFLNDWEKLPSPAEGWTSERTPQSHYTIRVRSVRFRDGSSKRFYQQVEKPATRAEREDLQRRALRMLAEIAKDDAGAIVRHERRVLTVRGKRF